MLINTALQQTSQNTHSQHYLTEPVFVMEEAKQSENALITFGQLGIIPPIRLLQGPRLAEANRLQGVSFSKER